MYLFFNFIYKVTITIFKEKYMQGFSLFSKPPVYKNIVGNTFDTGQVWLFVSKFVPSWKVYDLTSVPVIAHPKRMLTALLYFYFFSLFAFDSLNIRQYFYDYTVSSTSC